MLSFGVILRLVVSTGVVVGALVAVRWWSARGALRSRGAIRVLARTGVGRSAAVAVVEVGSQRFLVGAGEHSVNLLAVLDPTEELDAAARTPLMSRGGETRGSEPSAAGQDVAGPGGPVARAATNADGLAFMEDTREGPRIGPLAQLRRMTTRVPREVRIHGFKS